MGLPRGQNRDQAIRATIYRWAQTIRRRRSRGRIRSPKPARAMTRCGNAYASWANSDPQAASAAVLALPPGETRNRALGSMIQTLAYRDVQSALALVDQLPPGQQRNNAMLTVATNWANSDPTAAAQYVLAMPRGRRAQQRAPERRRRLGAQRSSKARWRSWPRLPDDNARRNAQQNIVQQWAQDEPRAAAEYWLKTDPKAGEAGDGTLAQVASHVGAREPAGSARLGAGDAGWRPPKQRARRRDRQPRRFRSATGRRPVRATPRCQPGQCRRPDREPVGTERYRPPPRNGPASFPRATGATTPCAASPNNTRGRTLTKTAQWLENLPGGASRDAAVSTFAAPRRRYRSRERRRLGRHHRR